METVAKECQCKGCTDEWCSATVEYCKNPIGEYPRYIGLASRCKRCYCKACQHRKDSCICHHRAAAASTALTPYVDPSVWQDNAWVEPAAASYAWAPPPPPRPLLPTPPQARRWATDQQHHQQQHQQQEYEQQQQQQHQPQQWRQQQHQQQLHSGLQDEDISSDSIERFRGLLNRIDDMREGLAKEIQDVTAWQSKCRVELIEVQRQVELLRVHNEMMSKFVTMQTNRAVADAKMHGEMRAEAAADAKMRAELLTEIQDLRAEMHRAKFNPASLVTELSDLRADVTRLTIPRVYADTAVPPPDIVTEAVRSASGSTEFDIVDTMPDESV
jgi:hypothetical protein